MAERSALDQVGDTLLADSPRQVGDDLRAEVSRFDTDAPDLSGADPAPETSRILSETQREFASEPAEQPERVNWITGIVVTLFLAAVLISVFYLYYSTFNPDTTLYNFLLDDPWINTFMLSVILVAVLMSRRSLVTSFVILLFGVMVMFAYYFYEGLIK